MHETTSYKVITPVAFFIFNRPEATAQVFKEIRRAQPSVLLVIADGPRAGFAEEVDQCRFVRSIVETIDWPCTVLRNYAELNLGCRKRISSGIDWVFSEVPEAIILEDDCLPDLSFFRFCDEMLEHFRHDERVMSVGGTNMLGEWKSSSQSYHFTLYNCVWGWATWRRAWQHYDNSLKEWQCPEVRARIKLTIADTQQFRSRARLFDDTVSGKIDTWDFQWHFAHLARGGLAVVPAVNLVSNIGFGPGASHTTDPRSPVSALQIRQLPFPIRWEQPVKVDCEFDAKLKVLVARKPSIVERMGDAVTMALQFLKQKTE